MAGADAWGIVLRKAEHALAAWGSPYLRWDFADPEMAVTGTALHALEWLFVRAAPVMLLAALVALILLRKRKSDCQKTSLKTCVTEQRGGVCAGGKKPTARSIKQDFETFLKVSKSAQRGEKTFSTR